MKVHQLMLTKSGCVVQVFSPEMRASFPNVTRYFVTLASQPELIAAVGKTELATAELKFTRECPLHTHPVFRV